MARSGSLRRRIVLSRAALSPRTNLLERALLGVILENYGPAPAAAVAGRRLYHDSVPHPTTYTSE